RLLARRLFPRKLDRLTAYALISPAPCLPERLRGKLMRHAVIAARGKLMPRCRYTNLVFIKHPSELCVFSAFQHVVHNDGALKSKLKRHLHALRRDRLHTKRALSNANPAFTDWLKAVLRRRIACPQRCQFCAAGNMP